MTGDLPADRLPEPPATGDYDAIPILMEPVPDVPEVVAETAPAVTQQSLFDDATPDATPRRSTRRAAPSPELARAAGHILRARAPAIIDEIVEAHTARLAAELRERLDQELDSLLAEMAGTPPAPRAGH